MPIQFSPVIASEREAVGLSPSKTSTSRSWAAASAIVLIHNFRVRGRPFPPHPHAGFSTVTYVFEDSLVSLRSRDSLGNDLVTGPGGIVWTQAGRGLMHEETPADPDRDLHEFQFLVNLSSKNKLVSPQVFRLQKSEVPEWRSGEGDRVRVLVGSFEGVSSPLVPAEPFSLLDVDLRGEILFNLRNGDGVVVYVLEGGLIVSGEGRGADGQR
jgi:redox-sensitive bicupin YhaK (pirin superfamily)